LQLVEVNLLNATYALELLVDVLVACSADEVVKTWLELGLSGGSCVVRVILCFDFFD